MACVVARGIVSWGSNSGKAQAQQKSVGEGKEIAHWMLKTPNAKQDLEIENHVQSSL